MQLDKCHLFSFSFSGGKRVFLRQVLILSFLIMIIQYLEIKKSCLLYTVTLHNWLGVKTNFKGA